MYEYVIGNPINFIDFWGYQQSSVNNQIKDCIEKLLHAKLSDKGLCWGDKKGDFCVGPGGTPPEANPKNAEPKHNNPTPYDPEKGTSVHGAVTVNF